MFDIADIKEEGFNSLQTGKCIQSVDRLLDYGQLDSFNSLQTGKCIQRTSGFDVKIDEDFRFQFPSNGKVYPKRDRVESMKPEDSFQFPSNGKVYPKRLTELTEELDSSERFQFPSNGKVYPKCSDSRTCRIGFCFNSLQTGKCIQRNSLLSLLLPSRKCFNSLQTGKCIQSKAAEILAEINREKFQFPSNGKVYPK